MRTLLGLSAVFAPMLWLASCAPSGETAKTPETKEAFYQTGHRLYLEQHPDTAAVILRKAVSMDSSYVAPLTDLAALTYEMGMREEGEKNPRRLEWFRAARHYFGRLEELGDKSSDVYERLCELCVALDDTRGFVRYARKNAELFPFDRQYYNLGLAYFNAGEYANTVKTQKEATEKFKGSAYIGGFYRQLGHAYMKMDRDQTAERTLETGLQAVNARIADLRKQGADYASTPEYRRLTDDKIGILVSLKKLHITYRATEKLEDVERQLKEAGYTK